jgi:hypothetical protein
LVKQGKKKPKETQMSVETEMKTLEEAVVADAKKAEETVVAEAKEVEGGVKDVVTAVETEVKAVEQKVATTVKRVRVDITTEEKLALRDAEASFLRAQVEIRDFQARIKDSMAKAESASKVFTERLESLVKKYSIDKASQVFDNIENCFKKL